MKKIIYTLLVTVLALSFMGCPSVYKDLDAVGSLDGIYLKGGMNEWTNDNPLIAGDTAGFYSVEFIANDTEIQFKFADADWGVQYCTAKDNTELNTTLSGVTFTQVDDGNGGLNDQINGLTKGKAYKFDIIAGPTSIEASLVEGSMKSEVEAKPTPFYLDGFYISGSMNGWSAEMSTLLWSPTLDEETGILTYKYDFAATDGTHEFGIRNNTSDWKVKYTNGEFAFGTAKDYVVTEKGNNTNNKITGLTAGNNYRIYVQTTPEEEVSYKVVILNTAKITVNVTGLPADANDAVMYLTGDYFDWNKPGEGKSIKGTVVDGTVSYSFDYQYEGTTFELTIEGKAAAAGWSRPEIGPETGDNAKFTVNQDKTVVTVTYVETTQHKEGGDVYRCKWEVK